MGHVVNLRGAVLESFVAFLGGRVRTLDGSQLVVKTDTDDINTPMSTLSALIVIMEQSTS